MQNAMSIRTVCLAIACNTCASLGHDLLEIHVIKDFFINNASKAIHAKEAFASHPKKRATHAIEISSTMMAANSHSTNVLKANALKDFHCQKEPM